MWIQDNVNPGLLNPRLINMGVSPFNGDSSLLKGTPPYNVTGFLIPGQHSHSTTNAEVNNIATTGNMFQVYVTTQLVVLTQKPTFCLMSHRSQQGDR